MAKIISIKRAGNESVYNMEVACTHNFAVNGGIIVHNCDSLRYFLAGRPKANRLPEPPKHYNFEFEKPKPNPLGYGERIEVI